MKIVRVLFSIIFSIVFSITLTVGIFVLTFNTFISKENIESMIDKIGIENFIKYDEGEITEIEEIYIQIPEVQELINKLANSSIDYIVDNKPLPKITDEDINKIVNSNYYESKLGIKLNDAEKLKYTKELKEQYKTVNESFEKDLNEIKQKMFENNIVKLIFSSNFKLIIIISLILLIILITICRWSLYRPLAWIGTATLISGLLSITGSYIIKPIALAEEVDAISIELMNNIFKSWTNYGIIFSIIGIIFIIIYFIFKTKNTKKSTSIEAF